MREGGRVQGMRPLRVNVADGWYHVSSRGLNRAALFCDDRDRVQRLELLGELPERFGVVVHAYVLMTNHDHSLVQTPRANLSAAMQWLNDSYAVWFNRRHGRLGPVFTRPYGAILIEGQGSWALEASRYLHLNPIRVKRLGLGKAERRQAWAGVASPPSAEQIAQRLRRLRAYRWSSYRAYAGYGSAPRWLTRAQLWGRVGEKGPAATAYRRWIEDGVREGVAEDFWQRLHAGVVLGSKAFAEGVRRVVKGNRREQPALRRLASPPSFEAVVAAMERARGEPWAAFRDRHGDPGRDLVLWLARHRCGLTLAALGAKAGGMDYLTVSKAVTRMEQRLHASRALRGLRANLEREMSNV